MPDLATHLCSVLAPGALLVGWHPSGRRWAGPVALTAVATAAPDVLSRVPGLALEWVDRTLAPMPAWVGFPFGVLHMPIGLVCSVVLAVAWFVPQHRRLAGACLGIGAALHLGLDLLQDHHGHGYVLAWPVSGATFELGLVGSEASVAWAPVLVVLTCGLWTLALRRTALPRSSGRDRG